MSFNQNQKFINNQPFCKKPRFDFDYTKLTPNKNAESLNHKRKDPFDDCFTCDELFELELVATQAEKKQNPTEIGSSLANIQLSQKISSVKKETVDLISRNKAEAIHAEQIERLKLTIDEKSGESKLLRDKIGNLERLLASERQAKLLHEKSCKNDSLQREKDLKKTISICEDQLEFKNAELQEAYSIIKSLESKNSILRSKNSFSAKPTDNLQTSLKVVKPENLHVFKAKVSKVSSSSDTEVPNRNIYVIQHSKTEYLIPLQKHCHFYRLHSFFSRYNRSRCVDIFSAVQQILTAQDGDNLIHNDDVETIVLSILCSLYLLYGKEITDFKCLQPCCCAGFEADMEQSIGTIEDCFQILQLLFSYFHFSSESLVEQTLRILMFYISAESLQSEVIQLLLALNQVKPVFKASLFQPVLSKFQPSPDTFNTGLVFRFFRHCVLHQEAAETLLCRDGGDPPLSILLSIRFCGKDFKCRNESAITEIIQFLTTIITHCDDIIARECLANDILHMICEISSNLLKSQSMKTQSMKTQSMKTQSRLLDQCLYCLYICFASLSSTTNLSGGHAHAHLFWEIREYLEPQQSSSLWKNELYRVMVSELDSSS